MKMRDECETKNFFKNRVHDAWSVIERDKCNL